jgi:hypothetical protein
MSEMTVGGHRLDRVTGLCDNCGAYIDQIAHGIVSKVCPAIRLRPTDAGLAPQEDVPLSRRGFGT